MEESYYVEIEDYKRTIKEQNIYKNSKVFIESSPSVISVKLNRLNIPLNSQMVTE